MIITTEQVTVTSNVKGTDRKAMTLKVGPEIFQILTKNLYANPALAAAQESYQNAADSHRRAGCPDKPFVVHLPTYFDPRFVVRDFGTSMSHEFIMNDYCVAGQSSKSQDADQAGGFGVGRLANLALSTTYNIACYDNGEKRTYSVYINSDGVPEIRHIVTVPSTEPRGVEITVPINEKDISAFDNATKEACRFYTVRPIVKGVSGFTFHENQVTLKGDGWCIDKSINFPVAVGGLYWYRIEPDNIAGLSDEQKDLLNSSLGLVLNFPPSALSPQASRQGLFYNDSTCAAIKSRLATLESEAKAVVQAHFDKCATIIEAKRLWLDYFKQGGSAYQLGRVFGTKQTVTWKGHVIDNANLTICEIDPNSIADQLRAIPGVILTAYTVKCGRRGSRSVTEDKSLGSIYVGLKNRLFTNDLDGGRGIKRRVGYEVLNDTSRTGDNYLQYSAIRFKTAEAKDAFHAANHTTDADLTTYFAPASAIIVPANVSMGGGGNEKAKIKVFKFVGGGSRRHKSESWEAAEIDEDEGGVYTTIFRYENHIDNCTIAHRLAILKKHNLVGADVTVYGIKTDEFHSTGPAILAKLKASEDWVELSKWFEEKRDALLPTDDIGALLADSDEDVESPRVADNETKAVAFNGTLLGDYLVKKLFIRKQVEKAKVYEKTMKDYQALGGTAPHGNAKPTYDMGAEWDKVVAAYPMLGKFGTYHCYGWSDTDLKLAAGYVALVEKSIGEIPYHESEVAA